MCTDMTQELDGAGRFLVGLLQQAPPIYRDDFDRIVALAAPDDDIVEYLLRQGFVVQGESGFWSLKGRPLNQAPAETARLQSAVITETLYGAVGQAYREVWGTETWDRAYCMYCYLMGRAYADFLALDPLEQRAALSFLPPSREKELFLDQPDSAESRAQFYVWYRELRADYFQTETYRRFKTAFPPDTEAAARFDCLPKVMLGYDAVWSVLTGALDAGYVPYTPAWRARQIAELASILPAALSLADVEAAGVHIDWLDQERMTLHLHILDDTQDHAGRLASSWVVLALGQALRLTPTVALFTLDPKRAADGYLPALDLWPYSLPDQGADWRTQYFNYYSALFCD